MERAHNDAGLMASLVEHFRICWEVWPEYTVESHEKRQIGFSLELYGTHESHVEHPTPGCADCLRVFTALQTIAAYILPEEGRPSAYRIGIYDVAIRYAPKRGNRSDVMLPIKILHRHEFERPVDQCEVGCLNEMKQRLQELGAPQGRWSPRKESA